MRVEHYAYFSIASHVLTGEEIADRVGLPGDEIVVKGSRRADPPVPVDHAWKIYADPREPYLFVQVEELLTELRPSKIRSRRCWRSTAIRSDASCG